MILPIAPCIPLVFDIPIKGKKNMQNEKLQAGNVHIYTELPMSLAFIKQCLLLFILSVHVQICINIFVCF